MKSCKALLSALLLSISWNCIAGIGTVTDLANAPPSIQRQKTTLTGIKGTAVEMSDQIKTQQGKVGITFQDETRVQVNENSKLVIDEFVYDPKAKGGKLGVKVALGTVRYASGQIAKNSPQNVNLNTPTATIAVRGTDFTATVDEIGASTIILLPSCPVGFQDVERDCKTGKIEVITDVGKVILDQPFQATRVDSRSNMPLKPVVINIGEDAINNMLILSPPKEFKQERGRDRVVTKSALDVDFLIENHLVDDLMKPDEEFQGNRLDRNFLDSDFLANVLDIVNAQLAAQLNLLNTQRSGLLPDYNATTGVTVFVDDIIVELCRDNGSDVMCVSTPKSQNSTVTMTQGAIEVRNRINNGAGTVINLNQR